MFSPAGADVIAQGTGSMIPTVGMSLMGLGSAAMTATNVLANAGEAAQNTAGELLKMSPEDWSKSQVYLNLRESGMSHQDAAKMLAPIYALPSQVVGGIVGGVSGSTGLEKTLAGKAIKGGAQGRLKRAGAELAGEELETIAPGITGNATQNLIDDKTSLFSGVGRDVVETAFGSLPGAALAAAGQDQKARTPGIDALLAPKQSLIPSAEQMMRDRGFLISEPSTSTSAKKEPSPIPSISEEKQQKVKSLEEKILGLGQQDEEPKSVLDIAQEMEAPKAEEAAPIVKEPALTQTAEQGLAERIGLPEGPARPDAANEKIDIEDAILLQNMMVKIVDDGLASGNTPANFSAIGKFDTRWYSTIRLQSHT